jgi:Protein of unknown function, DUF538
MLMDQKKKNPLAAEPVKTPGKPGKKPGDAAKKTAAAIENNRLFFKPGKENATNQDQAAREKVAGGATPEAVSPYEQVQAILKKHNVPGIVLPRNIKSFEYKPSNGALKLTLTSGFMKEIVDAKGKSHEVKFEQVLAMKLEQSRLNDVRGITVPTSQSARITDIVTLGNGYLRLTGRIGFFSKSIEIKQTDFPALGSSVAGDPSAGGSGNAGGGGES